jgi:hypothetical protein
MEAAAHPEETDLRNRLKHLYGELAAHNISYAEAEKDKILVRLQLKLGKSKAEIQAIIDSISL